MKHYTTLKQSNKLLELGLSPKSADMYYLSQGMDDSGKKYYSLDVDEGYNDDISERDIPCWSVGALESLIWESSDGCVDLVRNEFGYFIRYGSSKWHNVTGYNNTIIGACFEMVCWLLENGYIKKGE